MGTRRSSRRWSTAVGIALVATAVLASCTESEAARPGGTAPPGTVAAVADDTPLIAFDDQPIVAGQVDVGAALVGAEVRLVAEDGSELAPPVTTDELGLYGFEIGEVPEGAKVLATGGTHDGTPFDGHLAAAVERFDDGTPAPTYLTIATTLADAVEGEQDGLDPETAEILTRRALGMDDDNASLGLDVAVDDVTYPQGELLQAAEAGGGFDAFVDETASRAMQSTTPFDAAVVPVAPAPAAPTFRTAGSVTAAGGDGPAGAVTAASLTSALGNMVLTSIGTFVMQQSGFDASYNQLLQIRAQLADVKRQLNVMQHQIGGLAHQLDQQDFLTVLRSLEDKVADPVQAGLAALETVSAERAAVQAQRDAGGDTTSALANLDIAVTMFQEQCTKVDYRAIPARVTENFTGRDSVLEKYLNLVVRPSRYLTPADSQTLAVLFQTYRAYQASAGRLYAECWLLKEPNAAESIIHLVFQSPTSVMNQAKWQQLPRIMPQRLPKGVVVDLTTSLLWLDDSEVGSHPAQIVVTDNRIAATRPVAGPTGEWTFELAPVADIKGLLQLGVARTPAQMYQLGQPPRADRFPATLQPFLADIGLPGLASRISGTAVVPAFVWTGDVGTTPILRCNKTNVINLYCSKTYSEDLGRRGAALRAADLDLVYLPRSCMPGAGGCFTDDRSPAASMLVCGPAAQFRMCITDEQFRSGWSAPGIYRAKPLAQDRFASIDLTALGS